MSTAFLSEAYKDYPLLPDHVVPLDFDALRSSLPETHAWNETAHDASVRSTLLEEKSPSSSSIPLIDLRDPKPAELVGKACMEWGAFHIVGHGVPESVTEAVERESRRLFSLPTRAKRKALRAPGGTSGYGVARIARFFSKFMWHEGFTIIGPPAEHAKRLWPEENHNYQQFCDAMEEYQRWMKSLAEKVMALILEFLPLHPTEMAGWSQSDGGACTALQLNCYPPCPDPARAIGLAPHTDTSLLTILHQANACSGLQILRVGPDSGTQWVNVTPQPGGLFVHVGDLLHLVSNARFPSPIHRAIVNPTTQRLSFAYFYSPPPDSEVSPVVPHRGGRPRFCSVTVREYVGMKAMYHDKALSLLKI